MNDTQTQTASVTAILSVLPVGTIMPFGGTDAVLSGLKEQGWLHCNGEPKDIAEFKRLYDAIGSACGSEPGKFFLPDLQGVFLRGVDANEGIKRDPDSASRTAQKGGGNTGNRVFTRQEDEFKKHAHNYTGRAVAYNVFKSPGEGGYHFNAIDPKEGTTAETTGKETRPVNVSVNYIIFAGIPTK